MTQSHEIPATTLDLMSGPGFTPEAASRTSIVITEPEVAFSTAAAVGVQPSTTRWWRTATRVVAVAVRRTFLTTPDTRRSYWSDSVMAREMHRL
jgi:hypothetical protein